MKKSDIGAIIAASVLLLIGVGGFTFAWINTDEYKESADHKTKIKIEKLLNEGKITKAYEEASKMYFNRTFQVDKILEVEIANLVSESEGKSNFPKIIFAIKDKGYNSKEWYKYAIEMANMVENTELEEALKTAMDKKYNSKENK